MTKLLGRSGSWIGAAAAGSLNLAKIWLYQDFVAGSGPALTITANDNGTGISFNSSFIINSSAVVTKTNGNPIYTSTTELPANLVSVSAHTGASVTLDNTPAAGEGTVRIWYLYAFQNTDATTGIELAPRFVTEVRTVYLDLQYLNSGLNLSDLSSASAARTNLGFVAQTAGQVLIADGGTTFTSEAELFWDTGNNRLGIGTNVPTNDLHIFKASASPIALIDSQFTTGVPELRLSAARTTNTDLVTNDVAGRLNFYARYNSTNNSIARIDTIYTGSGTTQLGDLVFYTANAGSPAEALRVQASGNVAAASTITAVTSITSPIFYGSSSSGGSVTLRSTSDATKGQVIIGDQSTETTRIGPTGSTSAWNNPIHVLVPNSNSNNNGLVVQDNSANTTTLLTAASQPQGFRFLPRDAGGSAVIVVTGSNNNSFLKHYNAVDGTYTGYMSMGLPWGFANANAGLTTFKVSGTTGQSVDIMQVSNTSDFGSTVSSIGSDGQFRAPAGVVGTPGFAFHGDTNNGWWAPAADTQAWSLAGAEAMRLNSSGLLLKTALVLEDPGAGTNTVTIQAPTLAGSYTLTLPTTDGGASEFLQTNGSGVLTWAAAATPQKAGTVALTSGTTTRAITFATARADALYTVGWSFRNTTDSTPAQRAWNVIAKATTGFTVEWNDALDTANYHGDWSIQEHYDP